MTHIKLTTNLGGHTTGTTIEVTPGNADFLTNNGYAETVDTAKPRGKGKTTPPDTKPDTEVGGASDTDQATTVG